jgi:hypothetical protein
MSDFKTLKMKRKIIIVMMMSSFGLSSCKKSFLDDPKPQDGSLTNNIIFTTMAGANQAMTGIYWIFRSENYNGYGGSNNTGDLTCRGLQSTAFWFEVRSNDVYDALQAGDSWWGAASSWAEGSYGRIKTGSRTRQIWDMFYKAINNANAIIQYTPNVSDGSQAEKDALIAEAKAVRAYSYFWLARAYQFTYAKNPNALGIPIYTTTANKESNGNPRAPLKEVYNLILSDLEWAIPKLSTTRTGKYRINTNVAQGMLAEVYQELAMAEPSLWAKAQSSAAAALTGFPLMGNTQWAAGFNDINNPEWIWGFPVPDIPTEQLTYASIFSYMDPYYGYYRNIGVNTSLYNAYGSTDIRRARFVNVYGASAAMPYRLYFTRKFSSRSTTTIGGDIVIMRSSEMILIQAEALAHQNSIQSAIDMLFSLQVARDPAAVKLPSTTTQAALIDAILLERRKELYGEIAVHYFDLKRYQRPLIRDGNHKYPITVPASDVRWLVQIPQSEINANPNIPASAQNP